MFKKNQISFAYKLICFQYFAFPIVGNFLVVDFQRNICRLLCVFFAALLSAFIQKLTHFIVMLFLTVTTKLTVAYILEIAYAVCPLNNFCRSYFWKSFLSEDYLDAVASVQHRLDLYWFCYPHTSMNSVVSGNQDFSDNVYVYRTTNRA